LARAENRINTDISLYTLLESKLTPFRKSDKNAVDDKGGPLADEKGNPVKRQDRNLNHPCTSGKGAVNSTEIPINQGWMYFANGILLTGLGQSEDILGRSNKLYDGSKPPEASSAIYSLCFDGNGPKPPNEPGKDVFFINFQHRETGKAFFFNGLRDNGCIIASRHVKKTNGKSSSLKVLNDVDGLGKICSTEKSSNGVFGYVLKMCGD
jgi:hypothetical protein